MLGMYESAICFCRLSSVEIREVVGDDCPRKSALLPMSHCSLGRGMFVYFYQRAASRTGGR